MTNTAEDQARRKVVNRLKRARGQLDALINAVEGQGACRDVITQLSALTHALNRAGYTIVVNAMTECLTTPEGVESKDGLTTEELEKLFLSLA